MTESQIAQLDRINRDSERITKAHWIAFGLVIDLGLVDDFILRGHTKALVRARTIEEASHALLDLGEALKDLTGIRHDQIVEAEDALYEG